MLRQLLFRAGIALSLACGSHAWVCSLNMTADTHDVIDLAEINLRCQPVDEGEGAGDELVVRVDSRLRNNSFTGRLAYLANCRLSWPEQAVKSANCSCEPRLLHLCVHF